MFEEWAEHEELCVKFIATFTNIRTDGAAHPENPLGEPFLRSLWAEWYVFGVLGFDTALEFLETDEDHELPFNPLQAFQVGKNDRRTVGNMEDTINDLLGEEDE